MKEYLFFRDTYKVIHDIILRIRYIDAIHNIRMTFFIS